MELNFDNKEVKAFFKEVCKLGGNTKKIDTQVERNKLAEYLSGNAENMSENDIAILDSFIKKAPMQEPVQKEPAKDVELDVSTDNGSITQINIGNNNENNVNIGSAPRKESNGKAEDVPVKGEARPADKKVEKPAKKRVDKPVEKKVDKPVENKVEKPAEEKANKLAKIKGDEPVEVKGDEGVARPTKKSQEEFKYNVTVNLMPGPGPAKDLNFIKDRVCERLDDFARADINEIKEQVRACSSKEDIEKCLNQHSIGLRFVY